PEPEPELVQGLEQQPTVSPAAKPELVQGLEPQPSVAPEPETELVRGLEPKPKPESEPESLLKPAAPKRTANTEKSSITSGLWFGWQNAASQPAHPLAALFMPPATVRSFPWPGLPERSCRLVRFGGNKTVDTAGTDAHTLTGNANSEFIGCQLDALAHRYDVELPLLLLFLSSPEQVRQLIESSALSDSIKPCLSMPSISLKELTVQHYFEQAMTLGLIAEGASYPVCVIEQLTFLKQCQLALNQLPQWFKQLPTDSGGLLVKLSVDGLLTTATSTAQPLYVAFFGEQVQLYGVTRRPVLLNLHHFLSHLSQHLQLQSDKAATQLTVTLYQQPEDLHQRLDERFRLAAEQWQPHWSAPFCQFVNLSD
ncbi:MAG: hypothetical protein HRT35_20795, partial [Algicola sp.]|nr:hypothetical protein [Algicola sp.]